MTIRQTIIFTTTLSWIIYINNNHVNGHLTSKLIMISKLALKCTV